MELQEALIRVQTAYPRIYLACHSRHQNARTTAHKLSRRDSSLLAHLSQHEAVAQSDLARHLGVAKSTLSEALSALIELGFVVRRPQTNDGRGALLLRTETGTAAMSSGSVLETGRLLTVLATLTSEERSRAVEGLELIARAARCVAEGNNHAAEETNSSI
jgi:DNA-binding MarR family transcriptional regulator